MNFTSEFYLQVVQNSFFPVSYFHQIKAIGSFKYSSSNRITRFVSTEPHLTDHQAPLRSQSETDHRAIKADTSASTNRRNRTSPATYSLYIPTSLPQHSHRIHPQTTAKSAEADHYRSRSELSSPSIVDTLAVYCSRTSPEITRQQYHRTSLCQISSSHGKEIFIRSCSC